ncbi:hypothetical protein ACS0TY_000205 [Phlomoides rotata]
MLIFLDRNKLQQRQVDHWEWIHEHKGQYEVNKAYKIIQARKEGTDTSSRERKSYNKLWKSWVIRKATSTAWKILRNRAATTDNLERRGISFSPDELKCKFCKAQAESISHLFFTCPFAVQLWNKILNWLGICSALHEDPTKHWLQFGLCLGATFLGKRQTQFGLRQFGGYGQSETKLLLTRVPVMLIKSFVALNLMFGIGCIVKRRV